MPEFTSEDHGASGGNNGRLRFDSVPTRLVDGRMASAMTARHQTGRAVCQMHVIQIIDHLNPECRNRDHRIRPDFGRQSDRLPIHMHGHGSAGTGRPQITIAQPGILSQHCPHEIPDGRTIEKWEEFGLQMPVDFDRAIETPFGHVVFRIVASEIVGELPKLPDFIGSEQIRDQNEPVGLHGVDHGREACILANRKGLNGGWIRIAFACAFMLEMTVGKGERRRGSREFGFHGDRDNDAGLREGSTCWKHPEPR